MLTRLFHYFSFFGEDLFLLLLHIEPIMEVASLISSFWRRNLGTIDINLENAFGQQYSLLSLIMKKSKTLGFKHSNYSHTIYYILLRHIVHVLLPIIHISLYIIGASISIVVAYKDNGWNNAVVLNISVYICSLQGLLSEQTKNKSGRAIDSKVL